MVKISIILKMKITAPIITGTLFPSKFGIFEGSISNLSSSSISGTGASVIPPISGSLKLILSRKLFLGFDSTIFAE